MTKICIIGFGLAGIAAALELERQKQDFLLISDSFESNTAKSHGYFRLQPKPAFSEEIIAQGKGINNKKIVSEFCNNIEKDVEWLGKFAKIKETDKGVFCKINPEKVLLRIKKNFLQAKVFDLQIEKNSAKVFAETKKHALEIETGRIIVCSGGFGALFKETTNAKTATGLMHALCLKNGIALGNLEFVFRHPFGIHNNCIGTESLANFELFCNKKRLEKIEKAIKEKKAHNLLSKICLQTSNAKIIAKKGKTRIVLAPLVHYTLGGMNIDKKMFSSNKSLLAAGESSSGFFGADRIGGTALSFALFSGRTAAQSAIETTNEKGCIEQIEKKQFCFDFEKARSIVSESLPFEKNAELIEKGLENTIAISTPLKNFVFAALLCSLKRQESRGCFFRSDFPEQKAKFAKPSKIFVKNKKFCHEFGF